MPRRPMERLIASYKMFLKAPTLRVQSRWFSVAAQLQSALKVDFDKKYLVIKDGQKSMRFPGVWLRDNCQCPDCFHPGSKSRKINWMHFDTSVKIREAEVLGDGNGIKVDYSDQHSSVFDLKWLKWREFSKENKSRHLHEIYRPRYATWGKGDFKEICPYFEFNDLMQSDKSQMEWLESLAVRGVVMIKNAPLDKNTVNKLIDRVGFCRRTPYGENFVVQAKPGAKNYAYLSTLLQLHTDLPYCEYKPSVNLLHCVVQSESPGGQNLLADGYHVAERMRSQHPEYFKILTETLVDWNDIQEEEGRQYHQIFRSPVICLDKEGNYTRINYSVPQRDSHFTVELEKVIPWYEAMAKFVQLIHEEAVSLKTTPGDIITFNNIRLLHGRTAYDDTANNVRYIVGAYMDWDIIYSKLRLLKGSVNK